MSSRVKILYVQPNSEIGGSDICLLRMVQALDKELFEPVVVMPKDGPLVPAFEREGASVRFVPMTQLRTLPSPRYQAGYLGHFGPTVLALKDLILREQASIVHTNSLYSLYGAWAARLAGRPHVWHIREIPPNIPVARQALARMVASLSAKVLSMTEACQRSLFGRRTPGSARVLYEGISLAEFHEDVDGRRVREAIGVGPDAPLVGFAARLDPWKGLDVFLRSAALVLKRFSNAHFLVAGGAPKGFEDYERRMRTLAADLGLSGRVHFSGWQFGQAEIPELMAAIDLLSHNSINPEPFGLVLIEAMAMGRPVVATNMGGPVEIVDDGVSGVLTMPGKAQENADAVCALLADPGRRRSMGLAARKRVETMFPVDRFRRNITEIYNEVGARSLQARTA